MEILIFGVSVVAIIIAAIASFLFGFFWHSPMGFGNQWMKLMNISPKEVEKAKKKGGMGPAMLAAFVANLVVAFVLGWFITSVNAHGAVTGAGIGALAWLGFVGTTTLNGVLWEKRSMALWRFNNTYLLFNLMLVGAIVGAIV